MLEQKYYEKARDDFYDVVINATEMLGLSKENIKNKNERDVNYWYHYAKKFIKFLSIFAESNNGRKLILKIKGELVVFKIPKKIYNFVL